MVNELLCEYSWSRKLMTFDRECLHEMHVVQKNHAICFASPRFAFIVAARKCSKNRVLSCHSASKTLQSFKFHARVRQLARGLLLSRRFRLAVVHGRSESHFGSLVICWISNKYESYIRYYELCGSLKRAGDIRRNSWQAEAGLATRQESLTLSLPCKGSRELSLGPFLFDWQVQSRHHVFRLFRKGMSCFIRFSTTSFTIFSNPCCCFFMRVS